MMLQILEFVFCLGPNANTRMFFSFCLGIVGAGKDTSDKYPIEESEIVGVGELLPELEGSNIDEYPLIEDSGG